MRLQIDPRLIRLRHAQHYIAIATQAEKQYLAGGNDIAAGLALFDRERPNLDTARRWLQSQAGDNGTDDLLIADADAAGRIGNLRYRTRSERIIQLEAALEAAHRRGRKDAQLVLYSNLGQAYDDLEDRATAIRLYQQALTLAQSLGSRYMEGLILGDLGIVYGASGDLQKSADLLEQKLAIVREAGDRRSEGSTLANLGNIYSFLGDIRTAVLYYQVSLAIIIEFGDYLGEGIILGDLGNAYALLGHYHKSIRLHQRHLDLARNIGDQYGERNALTNLGKVFSEVGDLQSAIKFYHQALEMNYKLDDRQNQAEVKWNIGLLIARSGKPELSLQYLRNSLSFYQENHHPQVQSKVDLVAHILTNGTLPDEPDTDDQVSDISQVVRTFEPLLRSIADVARGDDQSRTGIEMMLSRTGNWGKILMSVVQWIWTGERRESLLVKNIDTETALLVRYILKIIRDPSGMLSPMTSSTDIDGIAVKAEEAVETALINKDHTQRAKLMSQLEEQARWASVSTAIHGQDWGDLAVYLRILATQLKSRK